MHFVILSPLALGGTGKGWPNRPVAPKGLTGTDGKEPDPALTGKEPDPAVMRDPALLPGSRASFPHGITVNNIIFSPETGLIALWLDRNRTNNRIRSTRCSRQGARR